MLVWNITTKKPYHLRDDIYNLEDLIGESGIECACQEGRDWGCYFQMSQEDIDAWEEVIGDATTIVEVWENCLNADWHF